ncbi:MAG: lipoyl protein ligase domain-containing protein [Chloroflexota bacterium]
MRLPRHDTSLSLPAEHPREALARDQALLEEVRPGGRRLERWYLADPPAVVVGLGLQHRVSDIVDLERCDAAGIEVLARRAGGGAVLVGGESMLCGAMCVPLPDPLVGDDLSGSYRWLGQLLARRLSDAGVLNARRVEVEEARSDVRTLRSADDAVARLLLGTCYGALSPHEVAVGTAKLVGLAQVRRRHAALFQVGILLQDQSPLADCLVVPDELTREALRTALARRTVGLSQLLDPRLDAATLAERLSLRHQAG